MKHTYRLTHKWLHIHTQTNLLHYVQSENRLYLNFYLQMLVNSQTAYFFREQHNRYNVKCILDSQSIPVNHSWGIISVHSLLFWRPILCMQVHKNNKNLQGDFELNQGVGMSIKDKCDSLWRNIYTRMKYARAFQENYELFTTHDLLDKKKLPRK